MTELNLDVLDTPAIRDILKCKAHLLKSGFPSDFAAVEALTIIAAGYKARVGARAYISQMLGELANTPVKDCRLYWADGGRIEGADTAEPVQKFIRRRFGGGALPFRVCVNDEEKYL